MTGNSSLLSPLDRMRLTYKEKEYRDEFFDYAKNHRQEAISLLNDRRLLFLSFFILLPEIGALSLYDGLNGKNRAAYRYCVTILENKNKSEKRALFKDEQLLSALKWIVFTGIDSDGFCSRYDRVIDGAVLVLLRIFYDDSFLSLVVDVIFKRNQRGLFHHDLVWALFETCDRKVLRLVAKYLSSADEPDVKLACELLQFFPSPDLDTGQERYRSYLSWLTENEPYIYFTGENFQRMSTPAYYRVNLDAKYLCRPVTVKGGEPVVPFFQEEKERLTYFYGLSLEEKLTLASFSHYTHRHDLSAWERWMKNPVSQQANDVKATMGGRV